MHDNHVQLLAYAVFVKRKQINGQMYIYAAYFILSFLPEHFVKYSFIQFNSQG